MNGLQLWEILVMMGGSAGAGACLQYLPKVWHFAKGLLTKQINDTVEVRRIESDTELHSREQDRHDFEILTSTMQEQITALRKQVVECERKHDEERIKRRALEDEQVSLRSAMFKQQKFIITLQEQVLKLQGEILEIRRTT